MIKIDYTDNSFNTSINRFLFYSIFIYFISIEWFLRFSQYPESLYLPQGIFIFLSKPLILSDGLIVFLKYLWLTSGVLAAVNIFYKISSFVFFLISFFAFNIAHNYGYLTHTYMPLVLAAAAMAFGNNNRTFLVRFIFCSIFFMAGFSKIRNSGLDWIFSENLQNVLIRSKIYYYNIHRFAQSFNINFFIAKSLVLTQVIAFMAVMLELLAPLALLKKPWSKYLVLGILFMQVGIYFTILVNFKFYLLLYIFWMDWQAIYNRLQPWMNRWKLVSKVKNT